MACNANISLRAISGRTTSSLRQKFEHASLDDFCKLNKNSQRWYFAWENLQEVFVMLVVVVLHSLLFDVFVMLFFIYCFSTSSHAFQSSSSQSDLQHFHFNFSGPFCYSFTTSATDLRQHFLSSGAFYITLLPDIWHNLFLS